MVEDNTLIPYVLSAAPEKHHAVITSEMRDKGNNLTLDDLEEAMYDQWHLTPEGKKNNDDEYYYYYKEVVLKIVWIPGSENEADMFTKNLAGSEFSNHTKTVLAEL